MHGRFSIIGGRGGLGIRAFWQCPVVGEVKNGVGHKDGLMDKWANLEICINYFS